MTNTNAVKEIKRINDQYQSSSFDVDQNRVIESFSVQLQIIAESEDASLTQAPLNENAFEKTLPVSNMLEAVKHHDKAEFIKLCADYFKEAIAPEETKEQGKTRFSSVFAKKANSPSSASFMGGVYSLAAEHAYKALHQKHAYQPPKNK